MTGDGELTAVVELLAAKVDTLTTTIVGLEGTIKEVDQSARARSLEVAEQASTQLSSRARSLLRRWIAPIIVVVVIAVAGGTIQVYRAHQEASRAHETAARFAQVQRSLVDGCQARQVSDAALRTKNMQLRDDTNRLADAFAAAPGAARLGPVLGYLRGEAKAYDEYLKAIPKPFDCKARYGR